MYRSVKNGLSYDSSDVEWNSHTTSTAFIIVHLPHWMFTSKFDFKNLSSIVCIE